MRSFVEHHNAKRRDAYRNFPGDLREHHGIEQTVLAGGYGYRQIMELIQNGADAIIEACEDGVPPVTSNRIHVLLQGAHLYVANTGSPLSEEGVDALLSSHASPKRGNQIGRFGLGFKSLLRLDGRIDLFTKVSGAIRFDPERCRDELRREFNVTEAPGLRLAWTLDEGERRNDAVLGQFPWAETIVRVEVRVPAIFEHLQEEMRAFPAEFLIFFPVPTTLVLDDGESPSREISIEPEGQDQLLHDGDEASRWRVAKDDITISDERALADATHIHARNSVPLAWAIPLEGKREEAGRFWAFFPTHTPTYLSGILNAPWKLNSDRNAIIGGEWNTALMREAARLIVEELPQLHTSADPGRVLDAFPRQMERTDEDAAPLVQALWAKLEGATVIPDATGILRTASELWRHPLENTGLAQQWRALAGDDSMAEMVHSSCLERQRGSRLKALAERFETQDTEEAACPNLRRCEATLWFSVVASAEFGMAVRVLKLAEAYEKECRPAEWDLVRPLLAIIPSDDGELLTSDQTVIAPEGTHFPDGRHPVPGRLSDDPEAKRILTEIMKVKPLDDSLWESMLREALPDDPYPQSTWDKRWCSFWAVLRSAPETVRGQFAKQNSNAIRVRRRDGEWVFSDRVLLPGRLVEANDTSSNQKVLVDLEIHAGDDALLAELGVCDFPNGVVGANADDHDIYGWLCHWRYYYRENVSTRASSGCLRPRNLTLPKGWAFLPKLSGNANAMLTERFLAQVSQGECGHGLKFGHTTPSYPEIDVSHPLPWFLLQHGTLKLDEESIRLSAIVDRHYEPAVVQFPNWKDLQPAFEILRSAIPRVCARAEDVRTLWLALIEVQAVPAAFSNDSLRELWSGAARDGVVPESLRTEKGTIPLAQLFVTGSPDLAQRARKEDRIVVTLDEHAVNLWIEGGARNLAELMSPEWTEQTGPATLLISTVPELAEVLRDEVIETARCQPVRGLTLVIAGHANHMVCLMWENTLLLDLMQLDHLSRADRLQRLLAEVTAAGWLKYEPEEALRILGDAQVDALRAKVAQGSTLEERLIRAVSNRREPFMQALGKLADMDFLQGCDLLQLAGLTLAQLGPATLSSLKDTLDEEGLKPPKRWNTSEARSFVASIGFPELFASSLESRREAEEFISGPIELPPLHDFQEEVLEGIKALLASGATRRRAVVSLPTGGGKTRVTVEGAVRLVLAPEGNRRGVLWVAQTDELCEQAVQAFRQVWINLGALSTDLRIVRLWGGNPNPTIHEPEKPVVVIASIQTLNSRMGGDGLAWLRKPGLVVVDECHHAITPTYSNLLRWLDAETPRPGAAEKNEPPIVGLSATPFRTDDEESQRLAKRFDNCWFPADQEELHERLCSQGVLAKADYEALQSGVGLLDEEVERLAGLPEAWEGLDFENILEAINQRLAGDTERSQLLVDRIQRGAERAILFFANSVQHAEEISARLNLAGISAAAVSGNTPTVARRYFLDRFQHGDIRVLCNHSVLGTGFDAPRTDMVLIARQVFSPVRYMQMVGRGLRGEKNGGTACCKIVTVMDNLGRFQERHPYHYCKRFFGGNG